MILITIGDNMKYRKLGKTGLDVSEISLGTEYLLEIPREEAIRVIHYALDQGINFFDLFFAQPVFRDTMGAAFAGKRDKALLAAHLGASLVDGQYERTRSLEESEMYFHDFLKRYKTDYVDVLYLHNSDGQEDYDEVMKPGGLYEMAMKFKAAGKTRYIGFSGHTVSTSSLAVHHPDIDVLMFPINLASNAVPGKKELLAACVEQNVGVVVMKPYAGGKLLQSSQTIEMDNWLSAGGDFKLEKKEPITAAQCLSYVLSQTGVSCIVPGCASIEHIEDALSYYSLSEAEKDYAKHLVGFQQFTEGVCVYCNHCLPCPVGIDIGKSIRFLDSAAQGVSAQLQQAYDAMEVPAGACIRCGDCEDRCPFSVQTMDKLEQAAVLYE